MTNALFFISPDAVNNALPALGTSSEDNVRSFSIGVPSFCTSLDHTVFGSISSLDGPQGYERGCLCLREPCHPRDVHAFVGSVATQGQEALPRLPLPEQDDTLIGSTRQHALVGTEGDRPGPTSAAGEGAQHLSTAHLPELDRLVTTRRCQQAAIGTKSH